MRTDLTSFIADLKQRLDMVEVIGRRLVLNKSLKALCPFHEEKTPSFSVNAKGQYYHCFGCGDGGDVIRFVERSEGKPFMQVVRELAVQVGITLPDGFTDSANEITGYRLKNEILTAAAVFHHQNLTPEGRDYLQKQRGFTDETVARFKIGFANGGLKKHLLEMGFSEDACIDAGVLKRHEGKVLDYFYKRIVFPNYYRGQVVHLTGRSLDCHEPKYLHLPGEIPRLFKEDILPEKEVLLCEGVPDTIAAAQAGYNAVGIYGTSGFDEHEARLFRRCEIVYVCTDADEAGRKAAQKIAQLLPVKSMIVTLPEGHDVNQFLSVRPREEFQALLDNAMPFLDRELDTIRKLPQNRQLSALQTFLPYLAEASDFTRSHYAYRLKREFGLNKKTFEKGVFTSVPEPPVDQAPPSPPVVEPSAGDLEKAQQLLESPDLFELLNATLEKMGCVGEENNKLMVYLTLTSRLSEDPINLIVKGDSSGGKSFLVQMVLRLFPGDEMLQYSTITPKSLYHRKDSLSHKALIIYERPGAEDSDYSIRTLQSEKKLIISTSEKNPDTQQWETRDYEVPGPVAYIETTTKNHLHVENETRCFEIFIDESEEQTRRIQDVQRQKYGATESNVDDQLRVWVTAQKLLRRLTVTISYAGFIKFPTKPIRVRRDFQRFLTLIEVSALLHQYQREICTVGDRQCIVATLEDYTVAFGLASVVLESSLKQLTPKAEQLAVKIAEIVAVGSAETFMKKGAREKTGWETKTVNKYLRELESQGIIETVSGGPGKRSEYALIRLPDKYHNQLLMPEELRQIMSTGDSGKDDQPRETPNGQVNLHSNLDLVALVQAIDVRTETNSTTQTCQTNLDLLSDSPVPADRLDRLG